MNLFNNLSNIINNYYNHLIINSNFLLINSKDCMIINNLGNNINIHRIPYNGSNLEFTNNIYLKFCLIVN